jgi:DnaJ family protein A protein 2
MDNFEIGHGEGKILLDKDRCKRCQGQGVRMMKDTLEVHIDKGMKDEQRIVLSGKGDEAPGITPGDIIIILEEKPHPLFERRGKHLWTEVTVTLTEALCGFDKVLLKHLDGRGIVVKHPPGQIIRPGQVMKIRDEGMPEYRRPFDKGDLFIKFTVQFPESGYMSVEQIKALESLLPPRPPAQITVDDEQHQDECQLEICSEEVSYNLFI